MNPHPRNRERKWRRRKKNKRKREKQSEKKRENREKMFRVNYYQSALNSQKEKLNILAEMLKISESGCTIRAPVGANIIFSSECLPQWRSGE